MKPQPQKCFGYCVIYRHKKTQEGRQMGMLGAGAVRLPPALSSLLASIARHVGLPDAKLKELGRRYY
jgi:hypothetical protein